MFYRHGHMLNVTNRQIPFHVIVLIKITDTVQTATRTSTERLLHISIALLGGKVEYGLQIRYPVIELATQR